MAIDEQAARRPDFIDGVPVEFPGGVVLHLPKPRRYFFREQDEDGRSRLGTGYRFEGEPNHGPIRAEHAAFAAALDAFERAEVDVDAIPAVLELAERMIRRNYAITDEQVTDLLIYEVGNPESTATFAAVYGLARGRGPQPDAVAPAAVEG
jgi:hypothetical protein